MGFFPFLDSAALVMPKVSFVVKHFFFSPLNGDDSIARYPYSPEAAVRKCGWVLQSDLTLDLGSFSDGQDAYEKRRYKYGRCVDKAQVNNTLITYDSDRFVVYTKMPYEKHVFSVTKVKIM